MNTLLRWIVAILVIILVVGIGFFALSFRPGIAPLPEGQAQVFDAPLIQRGAQLAAIGDCTSCHTAPGGKAFAGGLAVPTPFGTIYSTNITPDRQTGMGAWPEEAFRRAMHEGVDREGAHLYPAFPYDHFTHVTDDDIHALYAYLMTRDPVAAEPPANELPFPFSFRPVLAGWKLLFLKQGPLPEASDQSDEWARGRYLAEGLGHCAACHSPRNALGAEDDSKHFAGASDIEGWYAYPIGATSPAPTKWTVDAMAQYLQHGFVEQHGVARGPMAQVTANYRGVPPEDVHAIATYVVEQMGDQTGKPDTLPPAAPEVAVAQTGGATLEDKDTGADGLHPLQSGDSLANPRAVADAGDVGAMLYAGACSSCHDAGRAQPYGGLNLHLSTAVNADSPQNVVNMVLYGLPAPEGERGPVMPGYAGAIDRDQILALLGYLRSEFTDKPAWANAEKIVDATLSGKNDPIIYSSDGVRRAPLTGLPRTNQ